MAGVKVVGLSEAEAVARLAKDGPNRLPAPRRPSVLLRLFGELVRFFAVMLWVAAILAIFAGLPQLAVAIAAVIFLNAIFATVQQARADRAADRLRDMLPARVMVLRDGERRDIDAGNVVVDDVLVLEGGDRIPADALVLKQDGVLLDTSVLTGESEGGSLAVGEPVFAGTFVVEGACEARVTATGGGTRLASIARLSAAAGKPDTPLARGLRQVVRLTAAIAVGVGLVFLVVALLIGRPIQDGFVFAIGVTVALVPEALLPTVTLSLAWGSERMAKRNVLVRNLEAVETLGSTTFICTDKTGTLTRNEMTVVEAWTPTGSVTVVGPGYDPVADLAWQGMRPAGLVRQLALAGVRCSTGYVADQGGSWRPHGDPMEAALDTFARRLGIDTEADRATGQVLRRYPFDPRLRRTAVVRPESVIVKGAPDAVLALCPDDAEARATVERLTARGLRVLAVAARAWHNESVPEQRHDVERGMQLWGLLAFEDPPRAEVKAALTACRAAGVRVAMITGDHPATAAAIAGEIGLRQPTDPVLLGAELPSDEQHLGALLDRDGVVVARVEPEDKLRIARALHARGHVVAMTGDGVNDAPALHEADIGVAMGRGGTDVARDAADLVLLDDSFTSIVVGIEQGRSTYVNVRRFLTYHLTDNVAEVAPFIVWALSGGQFPLALGVLQILALDLATDTLSAVALGAEPPAKHLLEGPPVRGRLMNMTVLRRAFGVLGPLEAVAAMAAFVVCLVDAGWSPGTALPGSEDVAAASRAAFITVVFAQAANAFACRSATGWPAGLGWMSNRLLLGAVAFAVAIGLVLLWVPAIAHLLGQSNPPWPGWVVAVVAVPSLFAVDALDKWIRRRELWSSASGRVAHSSTRRAMPNR